MNKFHTPYRETIKDPLYQDFSKQRKEIQAKYPEIRKCSVEQLRSMNKEIADLMFDNDLHFSKWLWKYYHFSVKQEIEKIMDVVDRKRSGERERHYEYRLS